MVCEHCGKPVAPADRYCASCLAPRTPTAPLRTTPVPPRDPVAPSATPPMGAGPQPPPMPTAWAGPPPGWGAPAAPPPPTGPAGFWLRLAAWLIDGVVLGVAMGILSTVLGVVIGVAAASRGDAGKAMAGLAMIAIWAVILVVYWAYFAIMESSSQQATLGKLALGLAVTDLRGQRLGLGRATGRFFAKFLSGIPLYLGFVLAAFTERKQALHDLVAGTLVVRRRESRTVAVVVAVVAGGFVMVAMVGILAAIAIPNFIRYQLRAKQAEGPAMLRTLHAAELALLAKGGRFAALTVPDAVPGTVKLEWSASDLDRAEAIGWPAARSSYFTYRVAVAQTEDGTQAFSTCAEADLDGDGKVQAWVTWQPARLPGGGRMAPEAPCSHSPVLNRPVELLENDPEGTPVRVSPAEVF